MKELLKIAGIFALFVIGVPMLGLIPYKNEEINAKDYAITEAPAAGTEAVFSFAAADKDVFRVLCRASGQVIEMPMSDYVKGAVMAEMPASYEPEALKAQAVAAHTYAVRRIMQEKTAPDPALLGAYISDDSTKYQAFFTAEQAESFYGDSYAEYGRKVSEAVNAVKDEILVFGGEPVIAAFHAMSCGKTESAENVWGNAVPYLVPADSAEDMTSPLYLGEKSFTPDELEARLTTAYDISLPRKKEEWIKITGRSPSGTVTEAAAGDIILTGTELRALLDLRSACFEVKYDKKADMFYFSTKGSGHGVGMSQYGANEMAKNGADYREILARYYKGAELVSLSI